MNEDHYILLIQKQLSGDITPEERAELDRWTDADARHVRIRNSVQEAWKLSAGFSTNPDIDLEADFRRIERRISGGSNEAPVRPLWNRRWILRIAAAVLLITIGPYLLNKYLQPAVMYQVVTTEDSPRTEPVELVDGSKVWLNEHTEFSYFTTSISDERRVKITGEAFFEVAEDPSKPFVVETNSGEVTVLGTSFSVEERNGPLVVQVATGTVRLAPKQSEQHLILNKNEKGVFDQKENSLVKTSLYNLNEMAWKTGVLEFDSIPLEQTLVELNQYFGIEIELDNPELASCPVTVTFNNNNAESVTRILQVLLGAQIEKTEEGKYLIKGGTCG